MRKQRAFASLSEAEINQVAEWVRAQKYDDVIARVAQPRPDGFGLKVSRKPLQLLFAKVSRLEKINAHLTTGKKLSLTDLDQIEAGEKSDLSQEAHDAILIATHDIATNDDCNPTQLIALQRLADFPERAALRAQSAEDLSRLREQSAAIRAERLEIARSKEIRAKEMHTHKIALDLRKQTHKEKTAAFKRDLALARLNRNPNLNPFSSSESDLQNFDSPSVGVKDNSGRAKIRILVDQDGEPFVRIPGPCPLPDDVVIKNRAYAKKLLAGLIDPVTGEELPKEIFESTSSKSNRVDPVHPVETPSSAPSSPSALKSFLSPEVIANTNLYDQKIDTGEIRVIYAPGKHYEIEYCNPADEPALTRMHKSGPLRFVEDPTRTHFLPPLRTFGKNPYTPPTTGELNTAPPNTDLLITDHSPSMPLPSADKNEHTDNNPASPAPIDTASRSAEWHSAHSTIKPIDRKSVV